MPLKLLKTFPPLVVLGLPVALFVAQIAVGTSFDFAATIFLYFVCSLLAFNLLDGMHSIGGFVILFIMIRNIGGQLTKVALAQPAETNLAEASQTATLLAVGAGFVALAALTQRYLVPVGSLVFQREDDVRRLRDLSVTFYLVRIAVIAAGTVAAISPGIFGSILSGILYNMQICAVICVAVGTAYHLKKTGLRRSLGWANAPHLIFAVIETLRFGYKQSLIIPAMAYFATCLFYKKPYRKSEIMALGVAATLTLPVVFIYSQITRGGLLEAASSTPGFSLMEILQDEGELGLSDLLEVVEQRAALSREVGYFGEPLGVLDRVALPMFNAAQVVRTVEHRGDLGIEGIGLYFTFLPKSLTGVSSAFSQKGDVLAQFADIIDTDNARTGIEMDPIISSYAYGGWIGVTLLNFVVFLAFFTVTNVVFGPTPNNPWAVVALSTALLGVSSANIGPLIVYMIRTIPFLIVMMICLGKLRPARKSQVTRTSAAL